MNVHSCSTTTHSHGPKKNVYICKMERKKINKKLKKKTKPYCLILSILSISFDYSLYRIEGNNSVKCSSASQFYVCKLLTISYGSFLLINTETAAQTHARKQKHSKYGIRKVDSLVFQSYPQVVRIYIFFGFFTQKEQKKFSFFFFVYLRSSMVFWFLFLIRNSISLLFFCLFTNRSLLYLKNKNSCPLFYFSWLFFYFYVPRNW